MKLKNETAWKKNVSANADSYGKACVDYAERWANLMEGKMRPHWWPRKTKSLEEVAQQTSHAADTEGITGFMYGAAVSMLSQCWYYGEQLRRWHNLKTQLQSEGERANESGGVLNPALLNMDTEK